MIAEASVFVVTLEKISSTDCIGHSYTVLTHTRSDVEQEVLPEIEQGKQM